MTIHIQSPQLTARPPLAMRVVDRVGKLSHFHREIIEANINLHLEQTHDGCDKVCEIRLVVPGHDLIAKRRCETFEQAIDASVDALKHQIEQ